MFSMHSVALFSEKNPILIKPFLRYSSTREYESLSEAVHTTISLIDQHGGIF